MKKTVIYQVLPRLYGNRNTTRKPTGTIEENGCGKLNDFSAKELKEIKNKGVTHIWYTGVIRHASKTDYSAFGIPCQHPAVPLPPATDSADKVPVVKAKATHVIMSSLITSKHSAPWK